MFNQIYCDPSGIFNGIQPNEMTSPNDHGLAVSFYKARYNTVGEFNQNERAGEFCRNAGAVQLYKQGVAYSICGKESNEYNFVSYGNKKFKNYTMKDYGKQRSSYGHSERLLIRNVLDDLIEAEGDANGVRRPSELSNSDYGILKALTDDPIPYKQYLEGKGITVKMWSERPACIDDDDIAGGGCLQFIKNIFPEGSQFGYIVRDYTRADNETPTKIKNASEALKNAFLQRE